MVKKTKKIKRKFGEDSTFGRMYEFRGVRYWLYRRKDNFGACTGNYHTKIRVEGEPEVRRSVSRQLNVDHMSLKAKRYFLLNFS